MPVAQLKLPHKKGTTGMSVKTQKYTPTFPEMQRSFIGRKNISAKEKLCRFFIFS
jgi:hypothetical protein